MVSSGSEQKGGAEKTEDDAQGTTPTDNNQDSTFLLGIRCEGVNEREFESNEPPDQQRRRHQRNQQSTPITQETRKADSDIEEVPEKRNDVRGANSTLAGEARAESMFGWYHRPSCEAGLHHRRPQGDPPQLLQPSSSP